MESTLSMPTVAAALTVITTVFTVISVLITKLLIMPAISESTVKWNDAMKEWTQEADRRYVSAVLYDERKDHLDYLLSRHFSEDEKRQESIDKRLDQVITLLGK